MQSQPWRHDMKYNFEPAPQCNMCGSPTDENKILGKRLNKSQGLWPKKRGGITTTIIKCENCQMIYSSPLPIPDDIQDHYGVNPDNYWHNHYFVSRDDYFRNEIKLFSALYSGSSSADGLRALDIGAGLGKCMIALVNAGFETYGIEASETFYEAAITKSGIPASKLRFGRIEEADFKENSFDFITFGATLEHLYDPSAAIIRALKWLKPEGLIHVEVPSSSWLVNKLVNLIYKATGTDYVANLSPMHPPYHLFEFGLSSFRQHGLRNGYAIPHHRFHVCQTYMPRILDPILRWIMEATNTGMQLEAWLRKL